MAVDDMTAKAHDNSNDGSTPGGGGESGRLEYRHLEDHCGHRGRRLHGAAEHDDGQRVALEPRAELHASLSAIQWVTSGYLLALALMLPLTGWLVDRIGAKALYLRCFVAFTLSSTLCGVAWSANSLIAFRVLQGMSGDCWRRWCR